MGKRGGVTTAAGMTATHAAVGVLKNNLTEKKLGHLARNEMHIKCRASSSNSSIMKLYYKSLLDYRIIKT